MFTGRFKVCVCTGCWIRVCAPVWSPGIMLSGFVGFLFYDIPDVQCQTSWVSEPIFCCTNPFMKQILNHVIVILSDGLCTTVVDMLPLAFKRLLNLNVYGALMSLCVSIVRILILCKLLIAASLLHL